MKQIIAKHLLDIQAVFLRPNEPFTWASGILSPIYCDNRLTLSFRRSEMMSPQASASLSKSIFLKLK